jgi:hypothetical protein
MSIPSPLPLDAFELAIQADPEVLGVFYFGSLGRGAAMHFSDIDIFAWVPEAIARAPRDKLVQLLGLFGEVHFVDVTCTKGWVGPAWTQIDIEFGQRADLQPDPRYAGAQVIKDTDGMLTQMAATCTPEHIVETVESASAVIREALGDLLFQARHNARGSIWSAMEQSASHSVHLYELLGRLRGRRTYGFRYVEELLTPEEQALLTAAWPREPTRAEVRRSARALWAWTRHVWREAEHTIGQPLDIVIDEEAMLAAIERMYTR